MSASPSYPLDGLFPGLSPDQLIAEEEAAELPVPSTLRKRTLPSEDTDIEDEPEDGGESPSPGDAGSQGRSSSVTHLNPGTLEMDQAVRRMAKRLKLSNENVSLVEQFSQVSSTNPLCKTN